MYKVAAFALYLLVGHALYTIKLALHTRCVRKADRIPKEAWTDKHKHAVKAVEQREAFREQFGEGAARILPWLSGLFWLPILLHSEYTHMRERGEKRRG